ncbi:diacylglycerol kinase family protein, partial [Palleronia sp.]|uniref:diacylglycerol kinase family protein n=1 Tax=Palleronia sp. TaxID=1940284 RepID=UPI0035C7971F
MSVTYCSASSDNIRDCLAQEAGLFIVAGGDGTVCKVEAHLPDRRRPFGIIPLGGSNNVATSLGFGHRTILSGDGLSQSGGPVSSQPGAPRSDECHHRRDDQRGAADGTCCD